jgi:hypothetical protein
MYQFLIDEFRAHVANAHKAQKLGCHAEYLTEWQKAYTALSDFQMLIDEFMPSNR